MDNITKCIYMLISPSKKCYIGQTKNVKRRFREHRRAKGGCRRVYNAIRKYGWDNFLKVIIEVFDDDVSGEFIDEREIYWIKEHNTLSPNGYNLEEGGNAQKIYSEESRELMRKAKIGNKNRIGKVHTVETRALMSRASKGRICSAETRAKLSRAAKGRICSAETRAKLSRASKGRICSAETRAKLNSRKHSAETRAKLSQITTKYYENISEEAMAKHKERSYQNAKKQMKPIIATEKKTGIKRKFESTNDAARTLATETGKKFNRSHVSNCANKRPNYNSHHGWTFEFVT